MKKYKKYNETEDTEFAQKLKNTVTHRSFHPIPTVARSVLAAVVGFVEGIFINYLTHTHPACKQHPKITGVIGALPLTYFCARDLPHPTAKALVSLAGAVAYHKGVTWGLHGTLSTIKGYFAK